MICHHHAGASCITKACIKKGDGVVQEEGAEIHIPGYNEPMTSHCHRRGCDCILWQFWAFCSAPHVSYESRRECLLPFILTSADNRLRSICDSSLLPILVSGISERDMIGGLALCSGLRPGVAVSCTPRVLLAVLNNVTDLLLYTNYVNEKDRTLSDSMDRQ